ncbi:MAG: carboxymuconolactone decarboxylase family protein [Chloroflexi bacterium]|nr:carboxymuconolactone decarboxylase family protein [Chloroflexota bacterium]
MDSLDERYEKGQAMRTMMAQGDPSHFTLPGIDQLAPDLKRIINEALYGQIWARPGLEPKHRCMVTISALTASGHLPLLRRHIERGLNLGLTPKQVVEVFVHLTFYVGVPAVEAAMRTTKEIFEERGLEFTPTEVYDTSLSADELFEIGKKSFEEHIGEASLYPVDDTDSIEMELGRLIDEYLWGAIYTRPDLDPQSRAICAISAMTVMGQYDRQIRRRIEGALRVGVTPQQIMEVFVHLVLYGGYINSRTAMRVARSVFTEQGLSA